MTPATFTCPRCFFTGPIRPEVHFCPHCGMAGPIEASQDASPLELTCHGKTYRVFDRIAIGSVCNIYRCRFQHDGKELEGIFKIARDPCSNDLVINESQVLRRLHAADCMRQFAAFLPAIDASFAVGGSSSEPPRQANVLRLHEEIRTVDELYSLAEVRAHYRDGLDARDMAWIWRRLLNVLGFVHGGDVVHGAVLPMHVLIEPRDHKLLLIDWCCAVEQPWQSRRPLEIVTGGYGGWYRREAAFMKPPSPGLDIALGARCMIELIGGDGSRAETPLTVDPALKRYFQRCLSHATPAPPDAWRMLADFDELIKALWGERKFRVLEMPPKERSST